jgi:hypothetical protein
MVTPSTVSARTSGTGGPFCGGSDVLAGERVEIERLHRPLVVARAFGSCSGHLTLLGAR